MIEKTQEMKINGSKRLFLLRRRRRKTINDRGFLNLGIEYEETCCEKLRRNFLIDICTGIF